jgi:hypothetical protein
MLNLYQLVRNGILKDMFKIIIRQKASKEAKTNLGRKLFLLWKHWQHTLNAYFYLHFGKCTVVFQNSTESC